MASLQVKNISPTLHRRLRLYAKKRNCTLGDLVLEALEHELARSEFQARLQQRSEVDLGVAAATLLEDERRHRSDDV